MADDYPVDVLRVIDGDSVKVRLPDGEEHSVRMYGIDAPEKDQQFGRDSWHHLQEILSSHRQWLLHVIREDSYGRLVGVLFPQGERIEDSANGKMIEAGLAYWYPEYGGRELHFDRLERYAKADRVGVWGQEPQVRPWNHRKLSRTVRKWAEDAAESP